MAKVADSNERLEPIKPQLLAATRTNERVASNLAKLRLFYLLEIRFMTAGECHLSGPAKARAKFKVCDLDRVSAEIPSLRTLVDDHNHGNHCRVKPLADERPLEVGRVQENKWRQNELVFKMEPSRKLTNWLKQPNSVQFILGFQMYVAKVHREFSRSYERLVGSFENGQWPKGDYLHRLHSKVSPRNSGDSILQNRISQNSRTSSPVDASNLTTDVGQLQGGKPIGSRPGGSFPSGQAWDWQHFPRQLPGSDTATCITTCWMVYSVIRGIFQAPLSSLVSLASRPLLNMPGNCLLMGRVDSHRNMDKSLGILLCIYHIVWRSVRRILDRNFKITLINFLLHTEADLEQFYKLTKNKLRRPEYSAPTSSVFAHPEPGSPPPTTIPITARSIGVRRFSASLAQSRAALATINKHLDIGTYLSEPNLADRNEKGAIGFNEQLIRHTVCYPVYYGNRIFLRIRPNRTLESHILLTGQVAKGFIVSAVLMMGLIVFAIFYLSLVLASDWRYVTKYPGCTKELDDFYARGQLSSYSVTLTGHHLLSAAVDMFENLIVWSDSTMAILFVPAMIYLLNYDVLLYWSSLQAKLELLLEKIRLREALQEDYNCRSELISEPGPNIAGNTPEAHRQSQTFAPSNIQPRKASQPVKGEHGTLGAQFKTQFWSPSIWRQMDGFDDELEIEVHELQFELIDFFHEIKRVDLYVSDALTASIIIWLSGCTLVGYVVMMIGNSRVPPIGHLLYIVGLLVICTVSYVPMKLRHCSLKTYRTLCSLMAHDRTRKKRCFAKMLDFFTQLNRTTYTLAHNYPYEPKTFLTIIGWTISCFILTITLFGQKKNNKSDTSNKHLLRSTQPESIFERVTQIFAL